MTHSLPSPTADANEAVRLQEIPRRPPSNSVAQAGPPSPCAPPSAPAGLDLAAPASPSPPRGRRRAPPRRMNGRISSTPAGELPPLRGRRRPRPQVPSMPLPGPMPSPPPDSPSASHSWAHHGRWRRFGSGVDAYLPLLSPHTQNAYLLWVLCWRMCFHCAPPVLDLGSGMGSLLEIASAHDLLAPQAPP